MTREKRFSVRISAAGGDTVKAELRGVGAAGREAMENLRDGAGPAAAGLDRVGDAAAQAQAKLESIVAKSTAALAAMRAQSQASSPLVDRINRATGVTSAGGMSAAEYIAQGQALDDLRAKYNPVFAAIRTYRSEVSAIKAAHLEGAISADEMTAAINRSRSASLDSIAALRGRARGIEDMGKASRMTAMRLQMLGYQVNDVIVSLAGGMNPMMVFAQQGSQIAQIYGPGSGGVGGAMRDLGRMIGGVVTRFPQVSAALAVGAVAVAGLRHEINETKGVTVGFGDTALAVFQVIGRGIYSWIKPAVDKIGEWFSAAWDAVIAGVKWVGNGIINGIKISVDGIGTAISTVPDLFEAGFNGAAAKVFEALYKMGTAIEVFLTGVGEGFNSVFGTNFGPVFIPGVGGFEVDRKSSEERKLAAEKRYGKEWDDFAARASKTADEDPMGDFYNSVRRQAIRNSRDGKKAGGGGKEKDQVDELVKSLQRELAVLRETDPVKAKMLEYSEKLADATMAEKKEVFDLVTALEGAKTGWESIGIALKNYAQEGMQTGKAIGDALVGAFKGAEQQFRNFLDGGKFEFKEFVRSIIADMAMIAVRRTFLAPVADWLGGLFGGGKGGDVKAGVLHGGGDVGAPGTTRNVPAALFMSAPRLHGGADILRHDEIPAILQRGERVQSRAEVARGQSGQMNGSLHISLEPGLRASWLGEARNDSVQIMSAGMAAQERRTPQSLANYTKRQG
ncbi:phage tail length tape measure family protein [Seohaeicola nanhaiensis]|uniref:Phage tail length tape measure family protein n=1 Tax=Seohaeicola nanhaiensis TaxID=1387282 RepID=A0ABV9KG56_9RHOB